MKKILHAGTHNRHQHATTKCRATTLYQPTKTIQRRRRRFLVCFSRVCNDFLLFLTLFLMFKVNLLVWRRRRHRWQWNFRMNLLRHVCSLYYIFDFFYILNFNFFLKLLFFSKQMKQCNANKIQNKKLSKFVIIHNNIVYHSLINALNTRASRTKFTKSSRLA